MAISKIVPPVDYLHTASRSSLQSFELSRLDRAATLRREISALIDQWIEETAEALLARYMLEHHSALRQPTISAVELVRALNEASMDLIPNAVEIPSSIDPVPPRFAEHRHRTVAAAIRKMHK